MTVQWRSKTPQAVRAWIAAPPPWLQIKAPRNPQHTFDLDSGEAHAILLAQELGVLSLLIDERKGFEVAESVGLEPIGLLGILELCASMLIRFVDNSSRSGVPSLCFRITGGTPLPHEMHSWQQTG